MQLLYRLRNSLRAVARLDLTGDYFVILTTTPSVEGKQIAEYHDLATGEAILAVAFVMADEKELAKARALATDEL